MAFEHVTDYRRLAEICHQTRMDIVRSVYAAGSGHCGGALSAVEMVTALYYTAMAHDPEDPRWPLRDRFVMSKGHAWAVQFCTLAALGYMPREEILTFRHLGSRLQGHPGFDMHVPGLEASSGSLGHGLPVAQGMALASKLDQAADRVAPWRVYAMVGDGELQEGIIWEAIMASAHHRLDNFTIIVDNNDIQIDGHVRDVMNVYPLAPKFEAFNHYVIEIDGHSIVQCVEALRAAKLNVGRPTTIIMRTVKGKGVSYMEGQAEWHGKAPNQAQMELAIAELQTTGPLPI